MDIAEQLNDVIYEALTNIPGQDALTVAVKEFIYEASDERDAVVSIDRLGAHIGSALHQIAAALTSA